MAYTPVTVADFKGEFYRDFPYSNDDTDMTKVMDKDIVKALAMAGINFNEALWESQDVFAKAYLLLSAHFLVEAIRASSQGLNSQYAGNVSGKSVGSVSENYVLPERVQNSPFLASLYTSRYGEQYVQLLSPRLIGNVATIQGDSTP